MNDTKPTEQTTPETSSESSKVEATTPAEARPQAQNNSAEPATPAPQNPPSEQDNSMDPVELSQSMNDAADAAMQAATGETTAVSPSSEQENARPNTSEPAKVRGPRVVESGREYREGVVVSVGPDDIFVEFGPKSLGVVPRIQYREKDGTDSAELPKPGDTVKVAVDRYEAKESLYICSRPGVVQKAEWEMLQPGQIVDARCTGSNKGGLEMEVANHRAFIPASHVDTRRIEDLSIFHGEKMACKVIKVDRSGKGNITLSRREVLAEEQKKAAEELKSKLKEGETVEGVVKSIMPFGAFVDIGGVDGLVHISDLTHERARKVEDHVKEGETVRVQILKLDWEKGRHSLGMKQLQDDPFDVGLSEMKEGDIVQGRITKLLDFGAFAEIAPGVEGLVHISELDWKRIAKVSDAVQPNQIVPMKILKIDADQRKISLSVKQAQDRPAGMGGGGGGRGGKGGRGRGDRDDRSPEEILKETPELRRLREKAKKQHGKDLKAGLGDGLGMGLGDLKL
ncbi:MAG: 30S ribosomal protein S1 [Phycisphaerales bacterium JB050]